MAMEMKDKGYILKQYDNGSSNAKLTLELLSDIRDALVELVELKKNKHTYTGPR